MINNKSSQQNTEKKKESGFVDHAKMDVQCHLLVRDKDTKTVLVNQRG